MVLSSTSDREPTLIRLAGPIAASAMGDVAIGIVDVKLVGPLGPAAIGGVAIGATLLILIDTAACGLLRAVKILSSRSLARSDEKNARTVARVGVVLGAAMGILVWIGMMLGREALLRAVRVDSALVAPAATYLAARSFGSAIWYADFALVQQRLARGESFVPMVGAVAGNAVNAAAAYALIGGHFGMRALGVAGAGLAVVLAQGTEFVIVLFLVRADLTRQVGYSLRSSLSALRQILVEGGPIATHCVSETLAFTAFAVIVAGLGAAQIAGHQIVGTLVRTSSIVAAAFGEAATVLVARTLAVRRLAEADRITGRAIRAVLCFVGAFGVVCFLEADRVARAFTTDAELADLVARLLRLAAIYQVLDGVQNVLRGALIGAGDARRVALVGTVVVWTCGPGAAWLLGARLGWGAVGGYIGFVAESVMASLCFGLLWRTGAWRAARVLVDVKMA